MDTYLCSSHSLANLCCRWHSQRYPCPQRLWEIFLYHWLCIGSQIPEFNSLCEWHKRCQFFPHTVLPVISNGDIMRCPRVKTLPFLKHSLMQDTCPFRLCPHFYPFRAFHSLVAIFPSYNTQIAGDFGGHWRGTSISALFLVSLVTYTQVARLLWWCAVMTVHWSRFNQSILLQCGNYCVSIDSSVTCISVSTIGGGRQGWQGLAPPNAGQWVGPQGSPAVGSEWLQQEGGGVRLQPESQPACG